jgi:YidC/Oxa1 family membrane protein insertase
MDKQSIFGFVLIAVLITGWMFYVSSQQNQQNDENAKRQATEQATERASKAAQEERTRQQLRKTAEALPVEEDSLSPELRSYGVWFDHLTGGTAKDIRIHTSKYTAVFTTQGGSIRRWTLNEFTTWNHQPLELIDPTVPSDLNLFFQTSDGKNIDTRSFVFDLTGSDTRSEIDLKDSSTFTLEFRLPVRGDSAMIIKRYTLKGGLYAADIEIEMRNMAGVIPQQEYELVIHSPALTEQNSVDEASFSEANTYTDDKRHSLDVSSVGARDSIAIDGKTHWVSTHNKYFITALLTKGDYFGVGARLRGEHTPLPNSGTREMYESSLRLKLSDAAKNVAPLTLFIGPLKYNLLKNQHEGLEQVISMGWAWVVRPISEYIVIPLFSFLHSFIPNFGIVIIIFTLIIKLLLHPLTRSSMKSMRKMQALQPLMNEIREKNKDDQQKQNTEVMKLYKDYGVNPAGGCLPMLLQMPILFALFAIFRSTFELRQQPFALWITDLSSPDIIVHLPFSIPLVGMTFISGLSLAMAVTMFFQQKQSVQDPRQKAMVYMMPVLFWIMFNSFPSGLNLYYFMFNLLSIGQQYYVNKRHEKEPLQKVEQKNKKKSWSERMMSSLEDKAKDQKKSRKK